MSTVPYLVNIPFPSLPNLVLSTYMHIPSASIPPARSRAPISFPGHLFPPSPLTTSFCCTSLPQPYVNSSIFPKTHPYNSPLAVDVTLYSREGVEHILSR
jgi:hypothetical protein